MVAPGADGESRVRSFQATKGGTTGGPKKTTKQKQRARKKARKNMGEEMTAYEYWKQFINEADSALERQIRGDAEAGVKLSDINKRGGQLGMFQRTLRKTVGGRNRQSTIARDAAADAAAQKAASRAGNVAVDKARGGDAAFRAGGGNAALKPGMNRQQVQAAGMSAIRSKPKVGNIPPQEGTGKAGPSDTKPNKVITATNIAGKQQKVTTNKAYDVKVGGFKGTSTYGDKGQRMIRANIGNSGVNQVKAGKAKVGQSYAAKLGGVQGTVKYDAQGNRSFQALQKPAAPAKPSKPVK